METPSPPTDARPDTGEAGTPLTAASSRHDADTTGAPVTHVLRPETVRWAISTLHETVCHSSFFLYLFLRRSAMMRDDLTDIPMDTNGMRDALAIPGGPPNKPLFRPMSDRRRKDLAGFWIGGNLAGTYAFGSLRPLSHWLMADDHRSYALPGDHAERALETFLYGAKIDAAALAAFLLRDYGFELACASGHLEDLLAAFKQEFAFTDTDGDFDTLFDTTSAPDVDPWFEPAPLREQPHG